MNTEELIKQMAQGGITVQGDLVMEKHVEYEVSNVEAGGIGIQVVNGKVEPQAASGEEKPSPGPRKQYLFIEGDASWEKQGKRRDPSKENVVVCHRERDRFLRYLGNHCLSNRDLTCIEGDVLNDAVACFLVEWRQRGLIAQNFAGSAVWRFLTAECGLKTTVTVKAYGKEIKEWVESKKFTTVTRRQVNELFS